MATRWKGVSCVMWRSEQGKGAPKKSHGRGSQEWSSLCDRLPGSTRAGKAALEATPSLGILCVGAGHVPWFWAARYTWEGLGEEPLTTDRGEASPGERAVSCALPSPAGMQTQCRGPLAATNLQASQQERQTEEEEQSGSWPTSRNSHTSPGPRISSRLVT